MSERKVLNKYYPPDFDPSKIPRMKLAKNRQYTVRLMAPFNMRCKTCGEYIYKGKKFNARKEDVEHETYLGIRIYRFYIKCTRCLQEISFKTDPKNTDYEIEAGATRNFMALKLAEEQARKEQEELREEEANNPMKLLENRTEQSRNEIDLLESLEELKDLNRRHQSVDYETMLQQFDTTETERQRLERQEREDEEYIKSVVFKNQSITNGAKRIVTEEIIEEAEEKPDHNDLRGSKSAKLNDDSLINNSTTSTILQTKSVVLPKLSVGSMSNKNLLKNIVKRKIPSQKSSTVDQLEKIQCSSSKNEKTETITTNSESIKTINEGNQTKNTKSGGGLSLLSAYSDSSEDSN